jgi:HlyD family type I secretion membrane fusion protein
MTNDVQTHRPHLPEPPAPITLSLPPVEPLKKDLRGTGRFGLLIVALFFVVGGGWAATMPLAGATIASGVVSPEGSRRTVQHLEGGIIGEIKVREGDPVRKGDVLLVLKDMTAQATVDTLSSRLANLAAKEARLQAERTDADTIRADHPALADLNIPEVALAIDQQINELKTRRASDASRKAILGQQVAQLEDQIVGHEKQLESVRRQNALIAEELRDVEGLYRQGYERKARVLALQRTEAELLGIEGDLLSRVAGAREAIGEAKLKITNLKIERLEKVDEELTEVQANRIEVEKQIQESLDRLSRTAIVAPTDGIVMDLRFKTPGGVVRAGDPVLDIVPDHDELVIEARVAPQDIDTVHAGQSAYVMFPSFPQRSLHRIAGNVTQVSADAFHDEKAGQSYFSARVKVDLAVLAAEAPEIRLSPGLPAEIYIRTVERTLLEYLAQPILQVAERTFREQ